MGSDNASETFSILGRRRFDPMSVSRVTDFRLRPASAADSSLRWTPYCFDAGTQKTALVGCLPEVDLAAAPFYYQAQYQHARQLKLVDAAELQRLAAAHAPQPTTPVMIYSTGRAGTTLVSKMFARLPSCVSLSEPDFHTSLLEGGRPQAAGIYPLSVREVPDWLAPPASELLGAADRLYFQPRGDTATHLVLKFRGMCIELAATLRLAHPNVVEFFLYRDAEAYVVSSMRAFSYFGSHLWAIRWAHRLYVTRAILKKALSTNYDVMCRFFPLCVEYTPAEICQLGPVGMLTISWLSMIQRAEALALPSLRYENLMRDPHAALERLLVRCGIDRRDIGIALEALDKDSQAGSVLARKKTSRYELSEHDRRIIRLVLARHGAIPAVEYSMANAIA